MIPIVPIHISPSQSGGSVTGTASTCSSEPAEPAVTDPEHFHTHHHSPPNIVMPFEDDLSPPTSQVEMVHYQQQQQQQTQDTGSGSGSNGNHSVHSNPFLPQRAAWVAHSPSSSSNIIVMGGGGAGGTVDGQTQQQQTKPAHPPLAATTSPSSRAVFSLDDRLHVLIKTFELCFLGTNATATTAESSVADGGTNTKPSYTYEHVRILAHDTDVMMRGLRDHWTGTSARTDRVLHQFDVWSRLYDDIIVLVTRALQFPALSAPSHDALVVSATATRILNELRIFASNASEVKNPPPSMVTRCRALLYGIMASNSMRSKDTSRMKELRMNLGLVVFVWIVTSILEAIYSIGIKSEHTESGVVSLVCFAALPLVLTPLSRTSVNMVGIMYVIATAVYAWPLMYIILDDSDAEHDAVTTPLYVVRVVILIIMFPTNGIALGLPIFMFGLMLLAHLLLNSSNNEQALLQPALMCLVLAMHVHLAVYHKFAQELQRANVALNEYRGTLLLHTMSALPPSCYALPSDNTSHAQYHLSDGSSRFDDPASALDLMPETRLVELPHAFIMPLRAPSDDNNESVHSDLSSEQGVVAPSETAYMTFPARQQTTDRVLFFRCPLSSLANGVAIFGTFVDGTISYWSDGMEALFGYSASSVEGDDVRMILRGADDMSNERLHLLLHGHQSQEAVVRGQYHHARRSRNVSVSLGCIRLLEGHTSHGEGADNVIAQPMFVFHCRPHSGGDEYKAHLESITTKVKKLRYDESVPERVRDTLGGILDVANQNTDLGTIDVRREISGVLSEHTALSKLYRFVVRVTHSQVLVNVEAFIRNFSTMLDAIERTITDRSPHGVPEPNSGSQRALPLLHVFATANENTSSLCVSLDVVISGDRRTYDFSIPAIPCADEEMYGVNNNINGNSQPNNAHKTSLLMDTLNSPTALSASLQGAMQFRTVVLGRPTFRDAISEVLWSRGHTVFTVGSLSELSVLGATIDIAIVQARCMHAGDVDMRSSGRTRPDGLDDNNSSELSDEVERPSEGVDVAAALQILRQTLRRKSVIVGLDRQLQSHRMEWEVAGYVTLDLPVVSSALASIVESVETRVADSRTAIERLQNLRQVFSKHFHGEWEKGALLGSGASGSVYKATTVLTGGVMAVKVVPTHTLNPSSLADVLSEIDTFITLSHPNLIQYFFVERGKSELNIFMEFADGGTLQDVVEGKKREASEADLSQYVEDIARGVEFLHKSNLVHRDLKPENILLSRGVCKVADFGCAVLVTTDSDNRQTIATGVGTPSYMAPEVLGGTVADTRSDMWSLGCVLWGVATRGERPFHHKVRGWADTVQYVSKLKQDGVDPDVSALDNVPNKGLRDIIVACLKTDPRERCTAEELLARVRENQTLATAAANLLVPQM